MCSASQTEWKLYSLTHQRIFVISVTNGCILSNGSGRQSIPLASEWVVKSLHPEKCAYIFCVWIYLVGCSNLRFWNLKCHFVGIFLLHPLRSCICIVYISPPPKLTVSKFWNKHIDWNKLDGSHSALYKDCRAVCIVCNCVSSSLFCKQHFYIKKKTTMLHCTSVVFLQVMYHKSACLPSVSHSLFHLGKSFAWPSQQWTLPENKSHKKH